MLEFEEQVGKLILLLIGKVRIDFRPEMSQEFFGSSRFWIDGTHFGIEVVTKRQF